MSKPIPLPSVERLNELFVYHADIGELSWAKPTRRGKKTMYAGVLDKTSGYRRVRVNGSLCVLHRIIWKMATGKEVESEIDHINGIKNDNRMVNLRSATRTENSRNKSIEKKNLHGFKGVSRSAAKGRWNASIVAHGKKTHIGSFGSPELAHEAYWKKAQELYGEFARRS